MDKYCTVFFTTKIKLNVISEAINDLIVELGYDNKDIYYDDNSNYNKYKESEFPDGFLYFKYIIDIELDININDIVVIVNNILELLWEKNIPAIASCDFEEELIKKGGYRDENIPRVPLTRSPKSD